MPAFAFLGERFSRTHENQAFDQLFRLIKDYWQDSEERVLLIGNVTCNGHELDAILVKPDALVVIDFKNHGGRIKFSENGPWLADGQEVKGGSKTNPFKQLQSNKFALLNWINDHCSEIGSRNNLGHIAALVLFQKSIEFEASQLPGKVASWFHVADYLRGIEWLTQLASPGISLGRAEQDKIISALNVVSYQLPEEKVQIRDVSGEADAPAQPNIVWTAGQRGALNQAERMLRAEEPQILLITGMVSTGKTTLVDALAEMAKQADRELVALAPNASLASVLSENSGQEFRSIYGHIYDLNAGVEDDSGCVERPMRECNDAPNAVYLIDEAQLLNDAYFDLGNERFGSGRLVSDFLKFIDLKGTDRRLIILGDPFQVFRSNQATALINPDLLTAKDLTLGSQDLGQLIDDGERSHILETATKLVAAQRRSCFHTLDITQAPPQIDLLDESRKRDSLQTLFAGHSKGSMFITFSNSAVQQFTRWIRQKVRNCRTERPEPGDRIELFSLIKPQADNNPLNVSIVPHGSIGTVVSCEPGSIEESQTLKGRSAPISLRFRQIRVAFDRDPAKIVAFLYFEPFLEAEKPELDQDTLLALRIFSEQRVQKSLAAEREQVDRLGDQLKQMRKGTVEHEKTKAMLDQAKEQLRRKRTALLNVDPFFNAARIRFAYACTCHHAQGRKWPNVIIDAKYDDQGRSNEGYFRWLYTGITRATDSVQIANFEPLSPLDKTILDTKRTVVDPNMKSAFLFKYAKDKQPTEQDLSIPAPKGLTNLKAELVNLWLEFRERLAKRNLTISEVRQFPYQEHYLIENSAGQQATIILSYGAQYDVSGYRASNGDEVVIAAAMECLHEEVSFDEPLAQATLEILQEPLHKHGLTIEGGANSSWKVMLTISDARSRKATLLAYYQKDGTISKVEVTKVTDTGILDALGRVFNVHRGRA